VNTEQDCREIGTMNDHEEELEAEMRMYSLKGTERKGKFAKKNLSSRIRELDIVRLRQR